MTAHGTQSAYNGGCRCDACRIMTPILSPVEYGRGYAEGADWTLYGCQRKIVKHLDAPDIDDRTRLSRIRAEVAIWRKELAERGMV